MDAASQSVIDERRAAALTGLSLDELRWICHKERIGHPATTDGLGPLVFSYEEIRALCLLAARPHI